MKEELKELIDISRFYGNNKDFTIASGGNTSVKDDEVMYVKASGFELGKIREEGYVGMDRALLDKLRTRSYDPDPGIREAQVKSDLLKSRISPEKNQRPSVEASVHHAIRHKFVIHMHPTMVNAVMCSKQAGKTIRELFGDQVVFIPYITPGYILYREIENQNKLFYDQHGRYPDIIFLQNHGVFVGAETTDEIREKYDIILEKIDKRILNKVADEARENRDRLIEIVPAIRAALSVNKLRVGKIRRSGLIDSFISDPEKLDQLSNPFTPDGIVFCGARPLVIEPAEHKRDTVKKIITALTNYREKSGYDPKIVVVKGLGLFAPGDNIQAATIALDVFEDVLKIAHYSLNFGGPSWMEEKDVKFIEEWEVEAYRKGLIDQGAGSSIVENRVAVVTGGAQGFGKGIVEGLLAKGAYVQMIDVQEEVGQLAMKELEKQGYKGKVIFSRANVTKSEEVRRSVREAVEAFGGVDVLISNAGVLRAGALTELAEDEFDLVTEVNYKGYYLCSKYFSEPMKLQNEVNDRHHADIIQINSKSGLRGSNKNFAYAGGKFGGIGLTQSFALELVPWKIKVNAICPGNYFEGPLWSDPKNGLFAQYLSAGKVQGAKSIEDVKNAYESKVPMQRGCKPEDVMKAILYVIDQQYETGQAVPVTGGQVMLN